MSKKFLKRFYSTLVIGTIILVSGCAGDRNSSGGSSAAGQQGTFNPVPGIECEGRSGGLPECELPEEKPFEGDDYPVEWLEWGPSAVDKAKGENKQILMYFSLTECGPFPECLFEQRNLRNIPIREIMNDPRTVDIINKYYVPVKTSMRERPDVMFPAMFLGGWFRPVNLLFISPETMEARGIKDFSPDGFAGEAVDFAEDPASALDSANEATRISRFKNRLAGESLASRKSSAEYDFGKACEDFLKDEKKGGGRYFPFEFLYYCYRETGNGEYLEKKAMPFCGYGMENEKGLNVAKSCDNVWGAPLAGYSRQLPNIDFEIGKTVGRYSYYGDEIYRSSAEKTINFLVTFLSDPGGGFYDSQKNYLFVGGEPVEGKKYFDLGAQERVQLGMPERVKNIYVNSNIVIGSLLEAADVFGNGLWRQYALAGARRFRDIQRETGTPVRYIDESGGNVTGLLSSYAGLIEIYLDTYEGTGQTGWLAGAEQLAAAANDSFWDSEDAGYVFCNPCDRLVEPYIGDFRSRELNLYMARLLDRLYYLTDKEEYRSKADRILELARERDLVYFLVAFAHERHPLKIAVVGPREDPDTEALRVAARRFFEPDKVVMVLDPDGDAERLAELPYTIRPEPTLFACVETACSMPVSDPELVAPQLKRFADKFMYKGGNSGDEGVPVRGIPEKLPSRLPE